MDLTGDASNQAPKSRLRVLCAEDDQALAGMVKHALERAGHSVECVGDGHEAVEQVKAASDRFDVIVTDHQMPSRHGIQLVEEVRQLGFRGRIIVHSSSLSNAVVEHYHRLAVDRILTKPARLDDLVGAVEQVA